jgi:hypothetical protein
VAGTRNPEDAITAIKTIIEADLAAILDSIDTEMSATGDEVLDDIAKVWLAPQERHQGQRLPALTVMAIETTWDREHGEQEAIYTHEIGIELVMRGKARTSSLSPAELLTVKTERTVRGIIETLEAKRRLTVSSAANADYLAFTGAAYSELFEVDEPSIEKRAELRFLVQVSA